jgi:hypothetical protein
MDLGDPSDPKLVGFYGTTRLGSVLYHVFPADIAASDNHAYVAAGEAGLLVIDINRHQANPQRLGRYEIATQPSIGGNGTVVRAGVSAVGVAGSGNFCYVTAREEGLLVLDTSNIANPEKVGSYRTDGWSAEKAVLTGNHLYLLEIKPGLAAPLHRLAALDVTNRSSPRQVGACDIDGLFWAYALAVFDDFAYIAARAPGAQGRLEVVDIRSPERLQYVGGIQTGTGANDVAIAGNFAYVVDEGSGLQIIDVTNPATLKRIGTYDTGGEPSGICVAGNYAYIADSSLGLVLLDIRDPANPRKVADYPTGNSPQRIAVSGSYAYVGGYPGLQVIDISDPANPGRVGSNSAVVSAYDILVAGDRVLVAAYDHFAILELFQPPLRMEAVQTGPEFRVRVHGSAGKSFSIQRSANLRDWQDWMPITLQNGAEVISDPGAASAEWRFYRARQVDP